MVVRQLLWQSGEDFQRAQTERISWPTIAIDHYKVTQPDRQSLELNLRETEEAVAFWNDDARTEPTDQPILDVTGSTTAHRHKHRGMFLHLRLPILDAMFREGDNAVIDNAWASAWAQLSEICASGPVGKKCEPQYLVSPERLARFLFEELTTSGTESG
jgi:hypothetical protein